MKKMAAGSFKVHCLAVMDEVQAKRETVVITKHGKPVAKLIPLDEGTDEIYNFLRGKGALKATSFRLLFPSKTGASSSDSRRHARRRLAGARPGPTLPQGKAAIDNARKNGGLGNLRHHSFGVGNTRE